jgi:hypothetical protein
MDQVDQVKQALTASSKSTTVDELKARGQTKVRVVKAEQIAAMIAEAVQRAVGDAGSLSQEEHEQLVERSREEFKAVIKQREEEVLEARRAAAEADGLRLQLEAANQRADELRQLLENQQRAPQGGGGSGDSDALAALLDKLTGTLNERLDKFGRKMGISSAVEAGDVKLDGLFNTDVAEGLESNMDDVQVTRKTGSGIGGNLEKLKKLKGDG